MRILRASATAHFGSNHQRISCGSCCPAGVCPLRALSSLPECPGLQLPSWKVAWSEQSFPLRRVTYSSSHGCMYCIGGDKDSICLKHGRKCPRKEVGLVLVVGAELGRMLEHVARPGVQAVGFVSKQALDEDRLTQVGAESGFTVAFLTLAPARVGLPLDEKRHVALMVSKALKRTAHDAAEKLATWQPACKLALIDIALSTKHNLLRGHQLLAKRRTKVRQGGEEQNDDAAMQRLVAAARKRKILPEDVDLQSIPNLSPKATSWPPNHVPKLNVAALVLKHNLGVHGDSVAIDAMALKRVEHNVLPEITEHSLIMVGQKKTKARVLTTVDLLRAKGYPEASANLAFLSASASRSIVAHTCELPIALGVLCALGMAIA